MKFSGVAILKGAEFSIFLLIFGRPFVKRFAPWYWTVVCLCVTMVYCGQTVGWIKMKLSVEVGLGPGHTVLDGDPARTPKKGHSPPIFGLCLLWPNGWMDYFLNS